MSNPIPPWLIGSAVTAVSITPLSVASDGTLTAGTSISLTGHLDEITLEQYNHTENIVPLDTRQDNEVIVASGTAMTLIEILTRTGGNFLAAVGNSGDYVSAGFARGGKTWSGTFVVKGYVEMIRRGKCVGTLRLAPCGTGVSYS